MLRHALLSVVVLGALAAPAMADGLKTGGFYPGYGSSNSVNNTNSANGNNNSANQTANTSQQNGFGYIYQGRSR
jgi:hypothetical protein